MSTEQATLADLLKRLELVEAKEAIRDVLYRYARGADRGDIELFKSCYWPDATDLHWFYNGPAHSFADYVIPLLRQIPNSQHSITNPLIDLLDQNKAFVESQFYVLHRIPMDEGRWIDQQCEGRYLDVFEKREGEWKIKHRQMCMESLREFVVNVENGGGVKVMHPMFGQRMPEDPVYLGVEVEGMKGLTGFEVDLWGAARARWAGGDREKIEEQGQQQGGKPAL